MRRPDGYVTIFDPDARTGLIEHDTAQCCHCGGHIAVKPGTASTIYLVSHITPAGLIVTEEEPGAGCWVCGKPVCLPCHDLGVCRPLERWLDEQEGTKRPDQVSVGGFSVRVSP